MMLKNMSQLIKSTPTNKDVLNESDDFFSCSSTQEAANLSNMPVNSTKINDPLTLIASEIKNVWQMVVDCSRSSPESLGLFEDNLSSFLKNNFVQSEYIEALIKDNLKKMTNNLFKLNPSEPSQLVRAHQDKLVNFKVGLDFVRV
jgi:hypothetical protein